MARHFPLAGLLRLRQLREDEAAGSLATANDRLRASRSHTETVADALEGTDLHPSASSSLYAVAAARASARSVLADLHALEAHLQGEQDRAQERYRAARAATLGLEKLEDRHRQNGVAADLEAEQRVLDELASTGWSRRTDKDRP
jgi:flagellar FliJ protein